MRSARRQRWLVGVLTLVIVASGTPRVLAQDAAQHGAMRLAQATRTAEVLARTADTVSARVGLPPDANERRLLSVTPSGANPLYPLNHTFDAEHQALPSASNSDFEAAPSSVGTPPTNSNLEAAASDAGAPTDFDFASGTLSNWTTTGTVTTAADTPHGTYAQLGASGTLTSAAFTVGSHAQALVVDYGALALTGYNQASVSILTGAGYTTSTQLAFYSCNPCATTWDTKYLNLTAYLGQSVKIKVSRSNGTLGIDNLRAQVIVPGVTTAGTVARASDATQGTYAVLDASGVLTTAPFTVDSAAQYAGFMARSVTGTSGQFYAYVLSGAGYATSTQVVISSATPASWTRFRVNLSAWRGQSIELKLTRQVNQVAFDDLGLQTLDVPGWEPAKDALLAAGGVTGQAVSTNGNLDSAPFTIDATAQQLTLAYQQESNSIFYVELLRGPGFATVTDIGGTSFGGATASWQTLALNVTSYRGETVKLRIRQYWGRGRYDNVGLVEVAAPGWTLVGTSGIVTGDDAQGSYLTTARANVGLTVASSDISTAIVTTPNRVELRYYAISYAIGQRTSSVISVSWYNRATGQSWVVTNDVSNTPTGVRTKYFYLADFMGTDGYFRITLPTDGRLYSIADNIARQQLAEPFSNKVGQGIDSSTGSFGYQEQDLSVAGTLPLTLTRYYAGHADTYGELGYRWSHSYDMRVVTGTNGDAGVIFGSGAGEFYDGHTAAGTYTASDPRVHDTLVQNGDGTYTFTTTANLTYHFLSDGRLDTITDLNANSVTLAYDGSNRLSTVTAPGGQTLTFAYDANSRLSSVTDPVGAVVTYAYDANGDLTSVTDPVGKVRAYAYSRHRLTDVTDPAGQVVFSNTLDRLNRVVTQTDGAGQTITLAYDTPAKGATAVTDPLNHTATYYFDRFGRTTDMVDPLGNTITRLYDANGNLQKVIDPALNQWNFAFASNGDLNSSTDPLGHPTSIAYNPQHLPTTLTDGRGNVTTLAYDSNGNVTTMTDPLGNVSTFTYDGSGHRLTETNALNQTTTYAYDSHGNRTSVTDPLGNTWEWAYDLAGRLTSETDPRGNQTEYDYDLSGRPVTIRDATGAETNYFYDPIGHLVAMEDPLGRAWRWDYNNLGLVEAKADPANQVTSYTYDANRNLISQSNPLGQVTTYAYDDANRLIASTDPTGAATAYAYDSSGRVTMETDPLGRTTTYGYDSAGQIASVTLPNDGVYIFAYDAAGNRVSETDPLNNVTTYAYDALNRISAITDRLGNTTSYAYDAAGRATQVDDALAQTTTYAYDAAGRLTATTDPLGRAINYTYDAAGNRVGTTDPLSRTTTWAYDALNRVTSVTDPLGNATSYRYDAAGQRTQISQPSGAPTTYAYDARGLLTTVTDPLSHSTAYGYDDAGRRASVTDPLGHTTSYGYDAAGRQTTMTDALGGIVSSGYDAAGQRTSLTNPRGETTTFTYDAMGNLLTETDPLGRTDSHSYDLLSRETGATDARGVSVTYGYDALSNQTSVAYPGGGVSYSYDALGRRTGMTDPTGTTTWGYDAASHVTSIAAPQGTVDYGYDAAGQQVTLTLPGNRTVAYGYDAAGRQTTVTDWLNQTTSVAFDADGHRTGITRPNGVVSTFGYDADGRLTTIDHAGTGVGSLQSYVYAYDAANNRTAVTSGAGAESYTLDALNRLTNVSYPNGDTAAYTYDANGNRLTATVNGAPSATYVYDVADQLTSDGARTYGYDAAGNTTTAGSDSFAWDWANRLVSATVAGTTTTYAYDGDGTRVDKTTNSTTTAYLWDRNAALPALVDDGAHGYVQSDDGLIGALDTTGAATYPLPDALGSTRGAVDDSGALVGTTDYDAFGSVRAQTGATGVFGFTGEQHDPETGFTYLRARYTDPTTGRFLSADSVQPNAPGTQGYNPYAYVANNPTTWLDPSGHEAGTGVLPTSGESFGGNAAAVVGGWTLSAFWWARALMMAAAEVALACAAGCFALAVVVIVIFVIVACAMSQPCWDWVTTGAQRAWDYANDLGNTVQLGKRDWTLPDVRNLLPHNWPDNPLQRCVDGAVDGALQGLLTLPFTPYNPGDMAWNLAIGCASGASGGGDGQKPFKFGGGEDAPKRAYKYLQRKYGLDPHVASDRLHEFKESAYLGATDDVEIWSNGDVYDPISGDWLGNLLNN